jgi:hypothetical protein
MQYILIVHRVSMLSSITYKIMPSTKWNIKELASGELRQISIRLNNSDCFVRLELTKKLPCQEFDYTEEDYTKFKKLSENLEVTFVKYSDLQTLREVLNILSEDLEFYIDNDHGTILQNSEFMNLWNEMPTWDWARDSLEED